MLILTDANRLGFNLDQFGQGILQAARDGHGAPQADVHIRKFFCRQFRCRVHRRTGFGDDNLAQPRIGQGFNEFGGQLLGFARGRAVADGNQFDLVLVDQCCQRSQ